MRPLGQRSVWLGVGLLGALTGCSSSSSPSQTPGPVSVTVTITASGADLRSIEIPLGARVRFTNSDSRSHNMTSDPHPEHDACPAINQAGFLQPGQSRETGNFVEARVCGFHDHDQPDVLTLHGTITAK